jgi:hypothetical protein
LPSVIVKRWSNEEVKFVLSENEDCYYTVTLHGCSCEQFASGEYPCPHHKRAWVSDVRKLAERKDRLKREQEWLLERKQEALLEIEKGERYKKKQEERLREEERLKKEEPEKYYEIQEAEEAFNKLMNSMGYGKEQFKQEQQKERLEWKQNKSGIQNNFIRELENNLKEKLVCVEIKRDGGYREQGWYKLEIERQKRLNEERNEYFEREKKIEQNAKQDQARYPQKKARFYAIGKKKINKPISDMLIDTLEEDQNYYRDLYG